MIRSTIATVACVLLATLSTLVTGSGCYKCVDAECSNVPPINPQPPDWPSQELDVVEAVPDGSPEATASPCGRACVTFRRLQCPEGEPNDSGASCYRVCVHGARLRKVPAACWAAATSVAALRACGKVRCIP